MRLGCEGKNEEYRIPDMLREAVPAVLRTTLPVLDFELSDNRTAAYLVHHLYGSRSLTVAPTLLTVFTRM